jgi:tetratricopeptide (TPR) repeat protein
MVSERFIANHSRATLARAKELAGAGELEKAASAARAYLDRNPRDSHAWRFLANVHQSSQRFEEAISCAEQAALVAPDRPELLLEYGLHLVASGRRRDALAVAERLASVNLPTAGLNTARGTLLTYCDEPQRALVSFEAALKQSPDSCECLFNRASAQRMIGDLLGAEETLERVICLSPCHGAAHLMRSGLRVQTETTNNISELQAALRQQGGKVENSIALHFAVAKELEDLSRFDEAFSALEVGCRLQRKRMQYDVSQDIAVIDRIIQVHTQTVVGGAAGFPTEEPIFVVGLPRSGTTLIAQILAGHSSVHSIGETPALAAETISAVRRRVGRHVGKMDFVAQVLEVKPDILGKSYLEATRPQTGHTPRFVDKTPINYLYAGVIGRSLPGAKIVAVARDPMDVCFSMFKTLFTGAYPFSYDLRELGEYYAAWHRLIRHWQDVLGNRLLIVQYEDLIRDQTTVTRRLVKHCGLDWEDACLKFSEQGNAVMTASAAQIRRDLYSSSVGKSRHYGRRLDFLRSTLEEYQLLGSRLASG